MATTTLLVQLAAAVIATCCIAGAVAGPVVQTTYGPVEGATDGNVNVFHSIPFAAPPVGDLRFASPQPPKPWTETKDVTGFPNICPQFHVTGSIYLGKEDCLYLHVYTPVTAGAQKLPVMFWIFGGGYVLGDGYEFGWYDGQNLADTRNVVVVAPNYRVGTFGFLASEALQEADPKHSTGNQALLDQTLALQWVQDNIANFGGDPDRVAIYGESAGGFSICWHLVSPSSAGLFSAAIMESGSCDSFSFFMPMAQTFDFSSRVSESVGCKGTPAEQLACMRKLTTGEVMSSNFTLFSMDDETMQAHQAMVDLGVPFDIARIALPGLAPLMPWGPTIDGVALLDLPLRTIRSGNFNKVPTIFGTNENEGRIFVPMLPLVVKGTHFPPTSDDFEAAMRHLYELHTDNQTDIALSVAKTVQQYPLSSYENNQWYRAAAVLTDYFFACGTRRSARAAAKFTDMWVYQFTYKPDWIEVGLLGDYHTIEIDFVFGNQWPPILHSFYKEDSHKLSASMGQFWTNMAANGHPNDQTTSFNWPRYNETADMTIDLDWPLSTRTGLLKPQCDFWDLMLEKYF